MKTLALISLLSFTLSCSSVCDNDQSRKEDPPELDMATATIVPDADGPVVIFPNWARSAGATRFNLINDSTTSPNDTQYIYEIDSVPDVESWFRLSNVPADVATITAISVILRSGAPLSLDDGSDWAAQIDIYLGYGASFSAPYINSAIPTLWNGQRVSGVVSGDIGSGPSNTQKTIATGLTLTKTDGDNLWLSLVGHWSWGTNIGNLEVYELDVVVTYTPVATASANDPHKMHIGMGFGPGFR